MIIKIRTCYCFWLLARPFFPFVHISSEFPFFTVHSVLPLHILCVCVCVCHILIRRTLRFHGILSEITMAIPVEVGVVTQSTPPHRNRHCSVCALFSILFSEPIDCSMERSFHRKSLNNL